MSEFHVWGPTHLWPLAVLAAGLAVVVAVGRRATQRFNRIFAAVIVAVTVPLQIAQLLPGEWDLDTSLPLQLCDWAWVFAAHALWTGSRLSATVTCLWGLTLTTQAVILPDLASDFPEPRYLMFWAMHLLIVWAAVHVVVGMRVVPTWREYATTVTITASWVASMLIVNAALGTNYGYLNRKPDRGSILDLMGPWPQYLMVEIVIVAAVWAVLVVIVRRAAGWRARVTG